MDILSDWFDQPKHADVLLHIRTQDSDTEAPLPQGSMTSSTKSSYARTYHVHALVLSAHSDYFKTRLDADHPLYQQLQDDSLDVAVGSTRSCHVLVEILEELELDAMEMMLRCMYAGALPTSAVDTPLLLLRALNLANRFLAAKCVEAAASSLAAVPKEAIDYELLQLVYSPCHDLQNVPGTAAFLHTCQQRLVDMFGNVPDVITSKELQKQFYALPHDAVLAWVQSDGLRVHSENCVVFLLSAWIDAQQETGREPCSQEQLEQLAREVRVLHLGPAYLLSVLPNLDWFRGCSSFKFLPQLSCLRMFKAGGTDLIKRCATGIPVSWLQEAREACDTAGHVTFSWHVGADQLELLYSGGQPRSHPVYINGFLLELACGSIADESEPSKLTLGVYAALSTASKLNGSASQAIVVSHKAHVTLPSPAGEPIEKADAHLDGMVGFALIGWLDFLGESADTIQEVVEPYLVGGQLCFEASFFEVDQLPCQPPGDGQDHYAAIAPVQPDPQQADVQEADPQQPDPHQPDVQQADLQQPDPQQPDVQQADLQQPDPHQPDVQQADLQQPDPQQPDVQQADPQGADPQQPDLQQADPQQPDPQQPDLQQPDLQQPDPQHE